MSSKATFETTTFSAPRERTERFAREVLARVPPDRPLRILDLGYGAGELSIHLVRALPQATVQGVDISRPAIEKAEALSAGCPGRERLTFRCADYMTLEEPPFDVIVTYSTLHLVETTDEALFQKLARDLVPGGILVNVMPEASLFNRLSVVARRVFRLFRGRILERLALFVARRLHKDFSNELLLERLNYLYVIPARLDGRRTRAVAARAGLELVHEALEPHASLAQLRHRLAVFRKA